MTSSPVWNQIAQIRDLVHVDPVTSQKFQLLQKLQSSYIRSEGATCHLCAFFLPYDRVQRKVYLGDHKKAGDWIPPGGHLEPGETPLDAVMREMTEELAYTPSLAQIEPWNLSITKIIPKRPACEYHYDIWHLVHLPVQNFAYDPGEYHDAAWIPLAKVSQKIAKNPHFSAIITSI